MRFLLDTNILLWAALAPARLSTKARKLMGDPDNQLLFSSVSIWEIAIKQSLKRTTFTGDAYQMRKGLLAANYEELPLTGEHGIRVATLPHIHADPFDRILIAQAFSENLSFVTSDKIIARYPGDILKV